MRGVAYREGGSDSESIHLALMARDDFIEGCHIERGFLVAIMVMPTANNLNRHAGERRGNASPLHHLGVKACKDDADGITRVVETETSDISSGAISCGSLASAARIASVTPTDKSPLVVSALADAMTL